MKVILKILISFGLYVVFFLLYYFLIGILTMLPIAIFKGWDDPIWVFVMIASFFISLILAYKKVKDLMNL